ncbi:unnamed protein product [Blumeria hordei]|uniref:NADH:ubiquinone oxidoreductase intermediate-associated protein 30 domain-containing protein n=2 Tax=Blumeria hordei TaxID=2867405 RepID=A0A383UHK1_BLUHO|nr:CIA30 family protein [Blumeria hordei DH14]SZE99727.1 unnamed protein product [Blumeria hordei]
MTSSIRRFLFGGDRPWSPLDWTGIDDTVRGGTSYSKLICSEDQRVAVFTGNLDIQTLGGAGFASQRTTRNFGVLDLSAYDGIILDIQETDHKQYTFILKDTTLPPRLDGREQSSTGWEYSFSVSEPGDSVQVFWSDFKPNYRGREMDDVPPLNVSNITCCSLMMRSFFGTQEGPFRLGLNSISAFGNSNIRDSESFSNFDMEKRQAIIDESVLQKQRGDNSWSSMVAKIFCIG